MQEFMFLIHNTEDSKSSFTPEKEKEFVTACQVYIEALTKAGKMISAQPLIRQGKVISKTNEEWLEVPLDKSKLIQVGYYHILANDLDDAIAIAKGNPEFQYTSTANIEVRPIKMNEEVTQFVYPSS